MILARIRRIRILFARRTEVDKVVEEQEQIRTTLDERLNKIVEATLNGESEWFLEGIKDD